MLFSNNVQNMLKKKFVEINRCIRTGNRKQNFSATVSFSSR